MSFTYRPEIDGFRALAVTSVVLFHTKISIFANGFVGVDIFFVIYGFLITSVITKEHAETGFSYKRFAMRRARRILPVLVVVMLACLPFAWWLMLPDPLGKFGQSLIATVVSGNNILLWMTTGYWDLSSDYKPLMSVLSENGKTIRVTDANGVLLTTDRIHLSRAGAKFISAYMPDLSPDLYLPANKKSER